MKTFKESETNTVIAANVDQETQMQGNLFRQEQEMTTYKESETNTVASVDHETQVQEHLLHQARGKTKTQGTGEKYPFSARVSNFFRATKHNTRHAIGIAADKVIGVYNVVKHSIGNVIVVIASAFNKVTNWVQSFFSKKSEKDGLVQEKTAATDIIDSFDGKELKNLFQEKRADIIDSFDGKELKNLFQEAIVVEQMTVPAVRAVEPSAPPLPTQSIASVDSISNTYRSMTLPSDIKPDTLSAERQTSYIGPNLPIAPPSYKETMAMERIGGTTSSASMFQSMITGLYNVASNAVSSAANTASSAVSSAANRAANAASNAVSSAANTASNAANAASNAVSSAANRAANAASNAVSSAANTLSNNTLSNALGDAVSSAFTDTTQQPLSKLSEKVGVTKVDQKVTGVTKQDKGI